MSGAQHHHSVVDDAWDSVVGGFHWLKSVLLGEFEDNRPLSAIIADMLVSFIPAVVIATSARDAIAVILRMAKHPEKREEVLEWVLLCACLITIALPLAMAAAGVAAAGVGAVVGGIAGSELGAALRAVMLLLVKASTKLVDVIHFLQKFIKGDILKFLKAIKFAKYEQALLSAVRQFTGKLIEITQGLAKHLDSLSYFQYTKTLIAKLKTWERSFYAVQTAAIRKIPLAMAELDARLAKVLAETLPRETHVVPAGVKAPKPKPATPPPQRVRDVPGRLLRDVDESAPKAGASAKPAAGKASPPSHPSTPPPKPPDEKPAVKDRPDEVKPVETGANIEKQGVASPESLAKAEKIEQIKAKIGENIKDHPLRKAYESEVDGLRGKSSSLLEQGMPKDQVAHKMWLERRELGVKYKDLTPDPLRDYIYEVNQERYGDPLGPQFNDLVKKGMKSGLSKDQAYQKIIDSSSTPNSDVNGLLSKFGDWLNKKDPTYIEKALNGL